MGKDEQGEPLIETIVRGIQTSISLASKSEAENRKGLESVLGQLHGGPKFPNMTYNSTYVTFNRHQMASLQLLMMPDTRSMCHKHDMLPDKKNNTKYLLNLLERYWVDSLNVTLEQKKLYESQQKGKHKGKG